MSERSGSEPATRGERVSDHAPSSYAAVVRRLAAAGAPACVLRGEDGCVAVIAAAARVIAMAFSPEDPPLFWTHPTLSEGGALPALGELAGGPGGDRLWLGPEVDHFWRGPADWVGFKTYSVPRDIDPGHFTFVEEGPEVITLKGRGALPGPGGAPLNFAVERQVRLVPPPLAREHPLMREVRYAGMETTDHLALAEGGEAGRIDLWRLLQVPTGSTVVVPIRPGVRCRPVSYGRPGGWRLAADHLSWTIQGQANAKVGIPAAASTGRAAVLRPLEHDRWLLIVRDFPHDSSARYGDHPQGAPREDQLVQLWDGFGFGELEVHSPVLDAAQGPRSLSAADRLWAFAGSPSTLAELADHLLGVDLRAFLVARAAPTAPPS